MTNSISTLAATGTALDLLVAEVKGQVTVKKLRTRGPRKGETLTRGQTGGRPQVDGNRPVGAVTACNGGWNANGQVGIGKEMVDNLDKVVANYNKVIASEQKESRRQEAAERRALREAQSFNAIDSLLDIL